MKLLLLLILQVATRFQRSNLSVPCQDNNDAEAAGMEIPSLIVAYLFIGREFPIEEQLSSDSSYKCHLQL